MKQEHKLILKAILINKSEEEENEVSTLLENNLNWIEIVGILLSHRLGGYFYTGLTNGQKSYIPNEINEALKLLVYAQRIRQVEINRIIDDINKTLNKTDINYAFLKGSFYGCRMYELGVRRSNDIDLLVFEEDLDKLDGVMRSKGYIQSYTPNGLLIEATKKEKLIQRMNYHDLVPYVKQSEFGFVEFDINFLFDGKDNLIDKKVYEYGTENYKGNGCSIVGLNCYTNLSFLCVHFYREATNTLWTEGKRDLTLYKIADIANFIRIYEYEIDIKKLLLIFQDLNIVKKVFFTFKILREFYDFSFIGSILQELNKMIDDEKFMKEIYDHKNKVTVTRSESFYEAAFNVNK